jgi:hypothetical protein
MAFNVAEFRSNMIGDGARANLFSVDMFLPSYAQAAQAATNKIRFMAKSAQLPGSTIGTVPMFYFGREMKFAGNRSFADWTITIVNDEDFLIRNAMESWMNAINNHRSNTRAGVALRSGAGPAATVGGYTTDANVVQYGKTGNTLKNYNFVGIFPIDISAIDLDWGSNDAIEEFTVTFAYQYWETNSTPPSEVGQIG